MLNPYLGDWPQNGCYYPFFFFLFNFSVFFFLSPPPPPPPQRLNNQRWIIKTLVTHNLLKRSFGSSRNDTYWAECVTSQNNVLVGCEFCNSIVKTHLLSFLTRDWSIALSLAGSLSSSGLYCWAFTCLLMSSISWLIEAWERNSEDKCATLLAKVTTWDSKRLNRLLTALFEKSREKKMSWRNLSTMNCALNDNIHEWTKQSCISLMI